jgi:NAD(P)-dependent dehydrogenase (short-subunit alcohol dehydrogenase family)
MIGAGKAIWITGGSRGLGAALAKRLARRGARLALTARDAGALAATVREIREGGGEAFALPGDVGDKAAIHPLTGAAQAALGRIDVLVHAASALGPSPLRLLSDTDCEDLERVLAVNVVGPFRLTKAIAGAMALSGGGLVVHVSSDAALAAALPGADRSGLQDPEEVAGRFLGLLDRAAAYASGSRLVLAAEAA